MTHNFHPDRGAFGNLCNLPAEEAERVVASIRREGHAYLKENYFSRRMIAESWLIAERRRKIGETPLLRPIYFFLGDMSDGWDRSRPASIVLPLAMFDPNCITFTFPDSVTSCPHLRQVDPSDPPWLGQVFTFDEIRRLVANHGFPDPSEPREKRGPDAFIEVQIWNGRPLETIRRRADPP